MQVWSAFLTGRRLRWRGGSGEVIPRQIWQEERHGKHVKLRPPLHLDDFSRGF